MEFSDKTTKTEKTPARLLVRKIGGKKRERESETERGREQRNRKGNIINNKSRKF